MRFIGWMFAGVLLIIVGWIGGPAAMASYREATAPSPDVTKLQVAEDLIDAHRRSVIGGFRVNLSIVAAPPDYTPVRACGYDPEALLKNENLPFWRSTDWGFDVLQRRASADLTRIGDEHRADHLAKHHPIATMTVLSQCLNSPLASLCRDRVDRMVSIADSAGAKEVAELRDFSREQNKAILCTFLDGAAERRGIAKNAPASKPAR